MATAGGTHWSTLTAYWIWAVSLFPTMKHVAKNIDQPFSQMPTLCHLIFNSLAGQMGQFCPWITANLFVLRFAANTTCHEIQCSDFHEIQCSDCNLHLIFGG